MRHIAPWFRRVATYTAWPQMPRAHGPFGKGALSAAERARLAGLGLFLNVRTPTARAPSKTCPFCRRAWGDGCRASCAASAARAFRGTMPVCSAWRDGSSAAGATSRTIPFGRSR